MSQQRKTEKNQEAIRKIGLLESNRTCMDCTLKSTPYVVLDFGTFVCTFCAGVHRTHTFQAKGISMTNFKDNEVDFMKSHGNEKAEKVWRARFKDQKPKITEEAKIKQFIEDTYVKKKYYSGSATTPVTPQSHEEEIEESIPEPQPIQKIINNPAKIEVTRTSRPSKTEEPVQQTKQQPKQSNNFFDFTEEPVQQTKQPVKKQTQQTEDFDFFNGPATSNNATNNGFEDSGDFDVDFQSMSVHDNQTTTQPAKAKKSGLSLADELFANIPTQPTQQQFGSTGYTQPQQQQQTGGLDDFFGGSTQNTGFGGFNQPNQFNNNPYNGGFNQPNNFNAPNQGWNQQPNQGWNQPPQQHQYPPQRGGAPNQGWNQQPPQQQQWSAQPFGFGNQPQQQQQPVMSRGPQLNPAFNEPPKQQQQVNDPFATLGGGFGAPSRATPSPSFNTPKQPTTNNAPAFDDNPFDF